MVCHGLAWKLRYLTVALGTDLQGLLGADTRSGYRFRTGLETRTLRQGPAACYFYGSASSCPFFDALLTMKNAVQAVATVLAAFIQVGVKVWLFANVEGICTLHAKNHLTCPHNQVFFTASAIWSVEPSSCLPPLCSDQPFPYQGDSLDLPASSERAPCIIPIYTPPSSVHSSPFLSGSGSAVTRIHGLNSCPPPSCSTASRLSRRRPGSTTRVGLRSGSSSSIGFGGGTLRGGANLTISLVPLWTAVSSISRRTLA
jgi:hypothetical protein